MTVDEKRKELLHMNDRDLVNRILAFPDRERLNRDENGMRRRYPSGEMAVRVRQSMEKDPDYRISDKQKWAMSDSFARYSTNELKVAGITHAKADPNLLFKVPVNKEGVKTVYEMQFHLVPEPENEYDKNAVAVYVDNINADDLKLIPELENSENKNKVPADLNTMTRIGYVPGSYVAEHPITEPMTVKGTLTDHSNGHFKTISYVMNMDTEALDRELSGKRNSDKYTYRMPFILNGDLKDSIEKESAADYLNNQRDWMKQLNNEFEYWQINGHADKVTFEFPGGRTGNIIVETSDKLNSEAMGICGSYFRYSLESGISGDLKRERYVDVPQNLPAVNTRDKTYFSLQAEPVIQMSHASMDQLRELCGTAAKYNNEVYFHSDEQPLAGPEIKPDDNINSGYVWSILDDDKKNERVNIQVMRKWNEQVVPYIKNVSIHDVYLSKEALVAENHRRAEQIDFDKAVISIRPDVQEQSV